MMSDAVYLDTDRQLRLVMLMLDELAPGSVCMNTACPTMLKVPHMANDGGNHPHPYGIKPPWPRESFRLRRRDRKQLLRAGNKYSVNLDRDSE